MRITIHVTKRDITTYKIGNHYEVETSNNVFINFTEEALEELIADYQAIKEKEDENTSH